MNSIKSPELRKSNIQATTFSSGYVHWFQPLKLVGNNFSIFKNILRLLFYTSLMTFLGPIYNMKLVAWDHMFKSLYFWLYSIQTPSKILLQTVFLGYLCIIKSVISSRMIDRWSYTLMWVSSDCSEIRSHEKSLMAETALSHFWSSVWVYIPKGPRDWCNTQAEHLF